MQLVHLGGRRLELAGQLRDVVCHVRGLHRGAASDRVGLRLEHVVHRDRLVEVRHGGCLQLLELDMASFMAGQMSPPAGMLVGFGVGSRHSTPQTVDSISPSTASSTVNDSQAGKTPVP